MSNDKKTFKWRGEEHWIDARPYTWGVEAKALRDATQPGAGIDTAAFVESCLDSMVREASIPLAGAPRLALHPTLVWEAARALGLLDELTRIGVQLVNNKAGVNLIVREVILVEHRLRAAGYSGTEIASMPPEAVRAIHAEILDSEGARLAVEAELVTALVLSKLGLG